MSFHIDELIFEQHDEIASLKVALETYRKTIESNRIDISEANNRIAEQNRKFFKISDEMDTMRASIKELEYDVEVRDELLKKVLEYWKDSPQLSIFLNRILGKIKEILPEEPQWWDDIPEKGILCWVGDYEFDCVGNNIRIIMKKDNGVFHTSVGGPWKHAEPLTKDEIMEFLK